jgi:hypothetical protein
VHSRRPLIISLGLAVALAATVLSTTAAAGTSASLKIEPASVAVAKGVTFSVKVVQDAPVATSGAQASIDFDPTILQVVSVTPGGAYSAAPVFLPANMSADIKAANQSGHLAQVAAAFTPPDSIPPGATNFLFVSFWVVGCGKSDLRLPASGPFNAQMISGQPDVYGREVPVSTVDGQVITCVGADAVTADAGPADVSMASVKASNGITDGGLPLGLLGVAGVIAVAVFGGLVWLARRRDERDATDELGE